MHCTTNLAEHTQAFLGKPGSTETQPAISSTVPQRFLRIRLVEPGFPVFGSMHVHVKGAFIASFYSPLQNWIDPAIQRR